MSIHCKACLPYAGRLRADANQAACTQVCTFGQRTPPMCIPPICPAAHPHRHAELLLLHQVEQRAECARAGLQHTRKGLHTTCEQRDTDGGAAQLLSWERLYVPTRGMSPNKELSPAPAHRPTCIFSTSCPSTSGSCSSGVPFSAAADTAAPTTSSHASCTHGEEGRRVGRAIMQMHNMWPLPNTTQPAPCPVKADHQRHLPLAAAPAAARSRRGTRWQWFPPTARGRAPPTAPPPCPPPCPTPGGRGGAAVGWCNGAAGQPLVTMLG